MSLYVVWSFGGLQLILTSKIYLTSQIPLLKRTCTLTLWSYVSVQISHSVVSNSLQPHGLQHAWFLCGLPTPGACWNSCPSSWWFHPTISSSVVPFYSPYLMYTFLFSSYWKWKWKCSSLSLVWLCESMDCSPSGFSVQGILQARYWSGLPFPLPGDPLHLGIKPGSPALQEDSLPSELPGENPISSIKFLLFWLWLWYSFCLRVLSHILFEIRSIF